MNYQDFMVEVEECDGHVIIVDNLVIIRPSLKCCNNHSIHRFTFSCFDSEALQQIQNEFGE